MPEEYHLRLSDLDPRYVTAHTLSVHQCEKCQALVVEDFMPEHTRSHMMFLHRMVESFKEKRKAREEERLTRARRDVWEEVTKQTLPRPPVRRR